MTLRKLFGVLGALAIVAIPAGAQAKNKDAPAPPAASGTKAAPAAPAAKDAPAAAMIDINTATKDQLMAVKGIGDAYSAKIIAGRPYKSKDELWRKKVLPKKVYDGVKDMLIAKQK